MIPIPPTALGHLGDHEPQPVISSTRHPPSTPASHLAPNRPRAHREPEDAPPAFPSQSRKPAIECIQCMHCMHFPQPKRAHTSSFARKHTPGTHPFTPVSPGNSTKTAQFPLFSPLLNCSIGARPAPYASTAWAGTPRPSQNQAPRSHSRSTITASKNPSASNPSFTSSLIHLFPRHLQIIYRRWSTIVTWDLDSHRVFRRRDAADPPPPPTFSCFDSICNSRPHRMNNLQDKSLDRPSKKPSRSGTFQAPTARFRWNPMPKPSKNAAF